jgi:hypothetical protein
MSHINLTLKNVYFGTNGAIFRWVLRPSDGNIIAVERRAAQDEEDEMKIFKFLCVFDRIKTSRNKKAETKSS